MKTEDVWKWILFPLNQTENCEMQIKMEDIGLFQGGWRIINLNK